MKKMIIPVLAVVIVVLAFFLYRLNQDKKQLAQEKQTITAFYDSTITMVNSIDDTLSYVFNRNHMLEQLNLDLENGQTEENQRERINNRIKQMESIIEESKARIKLLEEESKNRGVKISSLDKMIVQLREKIIGYENQITFLQGTIDSLKTDISKLGEVITGQQQEISQKNTVIKDQSQALNTIYYIINVKKELKNMGIIEEKGGILGMRKVAKITSDLDLAKFTSFDLTSDSILTIDHPKKKVKIMSPQNINAFTLEEEQEGITVLKVVNIEEFRKVQYLVIMID